MIGHRYPVRYETFDDFKQYVSEARPILKVTKANGDVYRLRHYQDIGELDEPTFKIHRWTILCDAVGPHEIQHGLPPRGPIELNIVGNLAIYGDTHGAFTIDTVTMRDPTIQAIFGQARDDVELEIEDLPHRQAQQP